MPRIITDALQEGMKIETDVLNSDKMLLIPAGCVLTERHLSILAAWGISEVEIETSGDRVDPGDPLTQLDPDTLAQFTAELRTRFWQFDETNPGAVEIFQLMLRRQARRHPPAPAA